jgi:hypothetical protein
MNTAMLDLEPRKVRASLVPVRSEVDPPDG